MCDISSNYPLFQKTWLILNVCFEACTNEHSRMVGLKLTTAISRSDISGLESIAPRWEAELFGHPAEVQRGRIQIGRAKIKQE